MSTAANPRADNPQQGGQESTGAITKDSLAAESMRDGGEFSQNQNAHISSVSGSNSTFNTTDTSGASVLHAAPDGDSRADDTLRGMGSDDKGPGGMKYSADDGTPQYAGTQSDQGFAGSSSNNNSSSTGNKGSSQTTSGGTTFSGATGDSFSDSSNLTGSTTDQKDPAISSGSAAVSGFQSTQQQSSSSTSSAPYRADPSSQSSGLASNTTGPDFTEGQLKPKGKNLTEGDIPETKTFTGDVGGQHDPGRVAEQGFQKVAADDTVGAAADKYEGSGASGDARTGGAFDALSSERA